MERESERRISLVCRRAFLSQTSRSERGNGGCVRRSVSADGGSRASGRNNGFAEPVIACVRPGSRSDGGVVPPLKAECEVCEWGRGPGNWIGQQFTRLILAFDRPELPQHAIVMTLPVFALLIALA